MRASRCIHVWKAHALVCQCILDASWGPHPRSYTCRTFGARVPCSSADAVKRETGSKSGKDEPTCAVPATVSDRNASCKSFQARFFDAPQRAFSSHRMRTRHCKKRGHATARDARERCVASADTSQSSSACVFLLWSTGTCVALGPCGERGCASLRKDLTQWISRRTGGMPGIFILRLAFGNDQRACSCLPPRSRADSP